MVVDRDLFAGLDIAQSQEQNVAVQHFHVRVWFAGMIDVVRAVAAAAAIKAPALVDGADAQATASAAPIGFRVGNALAGILRDLFARCKVGE